MADIDPSCSRIPPRCEEPARPRALWPLLLLAPAACVAAILFRFNPSEHSFYPFCVFYRTTGLLCPGCGGLRSMHQLLHGHLAAAFRCNALLVSSLPAVLFLGARFIQARLTNRPFPLVCRPAWLWAGLVVMVLFGVLRNLPFAPFTALAPQ